MTHVGPAVGTAGWDWSGARAVCLREAQRVLGRGATAEDAAQEAVLRAWRHRERCDTPERPDAWLATIARHEALRLAVRRTEDRLDESDNVGQPSPESELVVQLDVRRALAALAPEERTLLAGRYWADLTHGQLAWRLGTPEGTIKVRLHRLRTRLREMLER
jgi:RNA polymerase sigma-70 factor, ECF subfamily